MGGEREPPPSTGCSINYRLASTTLRQIFGILPRIFYVGVEATIAAAAVAAAAAASFES